jgi:hypothetical protein
MKSRSTSHMNLTSRPKRKFPQAPMETHRLKSVLLVTKNDFLFLPSYSIMRANGAGRRIATGPRWSVLRRKA